MLDAAQQAEADLSAENVAQLDDPAVRARFDELMALTMRDKNQPFWGWDSAGRYIVGSRVVMRAVDDVARERRMAEARKAA